MYGLWIASFQFQSTHPRRVRREVWIAQDSNTIFQSTHPRRVRREDLQAFAQDAVNFNPRTRVGYDPACITHVTADHYFNPRTRVGYDL